MKFTVELHCPQNLSIDQEDNDKLVLKIYLNRNIDIYTSRELFIFMKKMILGGIKKIIVDVKDLKYIDSMGVGVFIKVTKMLRPLNGDIILLNADENIQKILGIAKVQKFVKVVDSEQEGLQYFKV